MAAHVGFIPDEAAGAYTVLWKYHPTYAAGIAKPPLVIRVIDDSQHKAYLQNLVITFCRKFLRGMSSSDASFVLAHEVSHYMLRHGELVWGWIQAGQVTGHINGVIYTFPYHEITCQHSLDMVINDGLMIHAGMAKPTIEMIEPQPGDFKLGEHNVYVREYKKKLEEEQKKQQQKAEQGNRPVPGGKPQPGQGKPQPLPGEPGSTPGQGEGALQKGPCNGNTKGQYPTKSLLSCEGLPGACLPQDPAGIDQVKQQEIIRQFIEELREKGQGSQSAMIDRLTAGLEHVKEDWRKVLRPRVVNAVGRDRETWTHFNQSALMVKSYRPATEGRRAGIVCLVCDTSGSIGGREQRIFLSTFADMYEQVTPRTTYLLEIDARVQRATEFKNITQMRRFIAEHKDTRKGLLGGGGTNMRAADAWLREHNIRPNITVFFTDGYTPYPTSLGNSKRVIWVMTNDYCTAPPEAGETIRFNNSSLN